MRTIGRLASFDRGFGWIKAMESPAQFPLVFPSLITPGKAMPGLGSVATVVEIEGTSYLLGETAVRQSGLVLEPGLREDEHLSSQSRLLAISTLALLAGGEGSHAFYVVAGLPHILMDSQASHLKAMLQSVRQVQVTVARGVHRYSCTISVLDAVVFPQGLGIAMDFCLDHTGKPHDTIRFPYAVDGRLVMTGADVLRRDFLVIDIGFNTALTYALNDMEPVARFCRGGYRGMAHAYQQVGQAVRGKEPWAVQELIAAGKMQRSDYEWAYRALADQLNGQIAGYKHPFDFYLIGGGGGAALYPYLLPGLNNKTLASEPQLANSRGFLKAGRQRWRDSLAAVGA